MYFEREKNLCENFIRRFSKDQKIKFLYEVNISAISIFVSHELTTWKEKKGERYLNYLIEKYNLAFIGYKNKCLI